MWRKRTRSNPNTTTTSSPKFSCSSFKDIQTLLADDYNPQPVSSPSSSSSNSLRRSSAIFHRVCLANSVLRALSSTNSHKPKLDSHEPSSSKPVSDEAQPDPSISLPGTEKRIVVYFTSLRVVRSTFSDCQAVESILRFLRVLIDERDVSMDSRFIEELQRIFGKEEKTKWTLPRVFIGGRYIGGAEEIRRLNETGELKKRVVGLAPAEPCTCEVCGGHRFILCNECSGSHKCYSEKGGFRSCISCNENGLIRCPSCSSLNLVI